MPEPAPRAPRGKLDLGLRAALYLASVVALSNALLLPAVDATLLAPLRAAIARACGAVLGLFADGVRVDGQLVYLGPAAVEVVNSCTGLDVAIFLAAAIAVFPAPARRRLAGIAAAFALILSVNFLRVLTLCWLNARSPQGFELVHVYVWPAFIALVCLGAFFAWTERAAPRHA